MADEEATPPAPEDPGPQIEAWSVPVQAPLPLPLTAGGQACEKPATLLMLIQSPEQPVVLVSRAVPFKDLVAYYQAADVAWITPMADGMNLVCKEFVAARVDGDGVLVLSEFAGASVQLTDAIMTNPYSHRSMDQAILSALDMGTLERKRRMKHLRSAVKADDIRHWRPGRLKIKGLSHSPAVA